MLDNSLEEKKLKLAMASLIKAKQDLTVIEKLVDEEEIADEIIGFHTQQTAEKSIKAILIWKGIKFRKTHDLSELIDLCIDEGIVVPQEFMDIDELTPFAVEFRYDLFVEGEEEPFDRQESLNIAKKVWLWADSLLSVSKDNATINLSSLF
ncbi:HEPN domain-containing protein [bacterium]|nr:HEPN domain-containing protein [bacterium]